MGSRLVNVRLDGERWRKAQALRERGVALSNVVREAIDDAYMELPTFSSAADAKRIVQQLFERYPDPPHLPRREYDVHNRRTARRAILQKIRRRP